MNGAIPYSKILNYFHYGISSLSIRIILRCDASKWCENLVALVFLCDYSSYCVVTIISNINQITHTLLRKLHSTEPHLPDDSFILFRFLRTIPIREYSVYLTPLIEAELAVVCGAELLKARSDSSALAVQ